ncbi:MAG: ester cyclase [Anaerolineae bacterium]|nr:ester cyclase [Anaerolineae bacterium]
MATEANKALVRRHYEEVLTGKNVAVIDELYAPIIDLGGASMEREQFKAAAAMMHTAFPDVVVTVQDQIAEGDKVVTRWMAQATHQGAFMGIPPTGKQVTVKAVHIHQIVDGRIAALWEEFDMFGLMQQLGV